MLINFAPLIINMSLVNDFVARSKTLYTGGRQRCKRR